MNVWMLLKSELRRSAGVLCGMALIIALALSLAVASGMAERMIRSGSAAAAEDFDILIGARGSSSALLLGTVFLRDEMLPLVPAASWQRAASAPGIRWAAPLAFGDRTPEGRPIAGTTRAFLTQGGTRKPAAGRFFESAREAVAGAASGLRPGDRFAPLHGMAKGAGHAHEDMEYTVVGTLPATGTPWDRAVIVPIESLWHAHGSAAAADAHAGHAAHAPLEAWMKGPLEKLPGFSAIVAKPASIAAAYRLRQSAGTATDTLANGEAVPLMAVFSGEVLVSLYAAFGNAAEVLAFICALTSAIALAAVLLASILLGRLRMPTLLLLRTLGAPRRYAAALVWLIVMAAAAAGALGSLILGWGAAELCAAALELETGAAMSPAFSAREGFLALGAIAAGAVCALIPAALAGRARLS